MKIVPSDKDSWIKGRFVMNSRLIVTKLSRLRAVLLWMYGDYDKVVETPYWFVMNGIYSWQITFTYDCFCYECG